MTIESRGKGWSGGSPSQGKLTTARKPVGIGDYA